MKKKIIILSTLIVAIVVLGSFSSCISANKIGDFPSDENVKILVNQYYGKMPKTIENLVSVKDAEEIKQILINLDEAITNNDENAISYYEKQLNDMGLFGEKYQKFYSQDDAKQSLKLGKVSNLFSLPKGKSADDISNSLCFLTAIGTGILVSYIGVVLWEAFTRLISNATSGIQALILILIFLPLVLTGIVLTSLIPIRIAMPRGLIDIEEGRLTSIGLQGLKRAEGTPTEPVEANISWFTGLSIYIPGNNETGRDSFMFLTGFAVDIKPYET